jgi:hypothetical protein
MHINVLAALLAFFAATGVLAATQWQVEQLRLDHAALVAAETDFRARRERGSLDGAEAADYAAYIARLQRRVIEDCVALARSVNPAPENLPCPQTLPALTQSADIDQQTELTRGEQLAVLDAELNTGLGEYDEMLLQEQERIKAATPRSDGIGDGSGTGQGDGGTGAQGTGEEGADTDGEQEATGSDKGTTDAGQPPDASPSRGGGAGTGAQKVGAGPPPDIPDGSDDDVVARQLREAAEKETDPELKEKLWEEYRKYKQGTR